MTNSSSREITVDDEFVVARMSSGYYGVFETSQNPEEDPPVDLSGTKFHTSPMPGSVRDELESLDDVTCGYEITDNNRDDRVLVPGIKGGVSLSFFEGCKFTITNVAIKLVSSAA